MSSGARATVLGGRHFEKADDLARALGGRAAPFENLREEMGRAEIVISSTGAPGTVIHKEDVVAALALRRNRPLFLIDIAVPRDVDREVRDLPGVFLYDLDDLKTVAEANLRERKREAAAAEALVEREVADFLAWRRSLDVVPLVVELRRRAEDIRRSEIEKVRSRLGSLTPEQEKAVDALDRRDCQQVAPRAHCRAQGGRQLRPAGGTLGPDTEDARPVSQRILRIGTRGSALALWQAQFVRDQLVALGHACEIRVITTTGDRILDRRLDLVGGKGAFLKEIEEALLASEVDVAVHSLKDVPIVLPPGLRLTAFLERADPRDAWLSHRGTLSELPMGARVGTTSLRRQALLAELRPDLVLLDLRGNVDTRIRKLAEGAFDAIVLAAAGLVRLGRAGEAREFLDPETFTPAPGQGTIAIECRESDEHAIHAVLPLNDAAHGPCRGRRADGAWPHRGGGATSHSEPMHVSSTGSLRLCAFVSGPMGRGLLRAERTGLIPEEVGQAGQAGDLLERGATRTTKA